MFNVIVDTREQIPLDLSLCASIDKTIVRKLTTGDYCIEGFEDILCIERKKSVSELAKNITEQRFENELIRMSKIEHAFLILEFKEKDILKFPKGSGIPKKMWSRLRVKSKFIMSSLDRIKDKYGIEIIFCGDAENAALIVINIMEELYNVR